MPSVVSAVVTAVKAFATWYAAQEAWVRLAVTLGATLAVDAASRKLFGKTAKVNKDFSRDITVRGAVQARKVVYGEALTSGPMIYTNVSGTDNKYLWLAVAVAGHEVSGMTDVYLDGTLITNANVNWGSAVSGGNYATYATFHKKLGTTTQTSQTELDAAFSDITSAHVGKEIAYVVGRFELVEESAESAFQSGPPQNISVLVQGKLVYDPRLDSTHAKYQGGVGTHRVATPSTWAYSTNPALCWADYLIDSRVGPAFATTKIDYDSVADEADYCEGQVQDDAGALQDRFSCNGVLYTTDTHRENTAKILSSMNGRMSYRAGKFVVRAGRMGEGANVITPGTFNGAYSQGSPADVASESSVVTTLYSYHVSYQITNYSSGGIRIAVGGTSGQTAGADGWFNEVIESAGTGVTANVPVTFVGTMANLEIHLVAIKDVDEDWLAGDIQINTAPPKASRTNTYHAIIKDPGRSYKDSETLEVTQSAYTDRDGEILRKEIELPMTNSEVMAQRILFKRLFATDQQKVVVLRCNYKALQLAPHDFIRVSISELSWVKKMLRVVSWSFSDIGEGGGINLTLKEDDSAAYAEVEPSQYSIRTAAGTVVVGTQGVPSFSNFTATSRFEAIELFADMPTPRSAWTHGVLYASDTSAWSGATEVARGSYGTTFIHKLEAGVTKYYWLKAFRDAEEGLREPNSDTSTVTATAGGVQVIQYWYQSSAPSGVGEVVGDLWTDSDDNKIYRHNGSSFVEIQDDDIGQAIIDAAAALTAANGKIISFFQTSPPTALATGDIWFDTDDDNKSYRWSGASWVDAQDDGIAQGIADALAAQTDANTAQATADGKVFTWVQASAPTADGIGDLWMDTDDGNKLYRWSGGAWVDYRDTTISDAQTDADTAQTTADSKIITFFQASSPTAEATGDIWYDTDDENKSYRWSGAAWVESTITALTADGDETSGSDVGSLIGIPSNTALAGVIGKSTSGGGVEGQSSTSVGTSGLVHGSSGYGVHAFTLGGASTYGFLVSGGLSSAKCALVQNNNDWHGDIAFQDDVDVVGDVDVTLDMTIHNDLFVDRSSHLAQDGVSGDSTVRVGVSAGHGDPTITGLNTIAIAEGSGGSRVDGQIQLCAPISSDGDTTLGWNSEQGTEAIGTFTPSAKFKIIINANEYWIALDLV